MAIKKKRPKAPATIRSRICQTRLTPGEYEAVTAQAQAAGVSLSQYLRHRALGLRVMSKVDKIMIGQLNRIGGLIKHVSAEANGQYSPEVASAIKAIATYISVISATPKKEGAE